MHLIVGLGNPGREYRNSRHNVGFWCLDQMAKKWDVSVNRRRPKVILGEGVVAGQDVVLAKPRTFMNRSGEGVRYLLDRYGVAPTDILVVYDDMDLPVGKTRIRAKGSAGGHNGLKSIIAALGTLEFPRLRVGIGRSWHSQDNISFVLGSFEQEEGALIEEAMGRSVEAAGCIIEESLEAAMNRFNGG